MHPFVRSLRFIMAQQRERTSVAVERQTTQISVGRKLIRLDSFVPKRHAPTPIIFLHGMSPLGIDDPRQIIAVEALAAAGFKVLCPEINAIRQLRIRRESLVLFNEVVLKILSTSTLSPTGRISLFAPSFSGAICLRTAAEPRLYDKIQAVCTIGTLAGLRRSIEFLFTNAADPYARDIVLANYLPRIKKYKKIASIFRASALDNWHESAAKNAALQANISTRLRATEHLARLTKRERKLYESLAANMELCRRVFSELEPYMAREFAAYDVATVANQVIAPVFLLHGKHDNVIPPIESEELASKLHRCRLVVSPFIGHSDARFLARFIGDAYRLIAGFAWYFGHAARE